MSEFQTSKRAGDDRAFQVTHNEVLGIAVPVTLTYITTPLLGVVDTAVVGRLGDAALLGGLAVGGILFSIIFSAFYFLRAGATAMVAHKVGAGDHSAMGLVVVRFLLVAAGGGLLCLALSWPIRGISLWVMDVPSSVLSATIAYFDIRILAAPFTLINFTILGCLIGVGRSGLGLIVQSLLNGTNIILSFWLGLGLNWGLPGVAWATVLAELLATCVGLMIIWHLILRNRQWRMGEIIDRQEWLRLFSINGDIMIRSVILLFGIAYFTAQGSHFGEIVLAANAVLMNFIVLAGYFLDGLATSAEQLVGRSVGARYRPAFDRTLKLTGVWSLAMALLLVALFAALGDAFIDWLTVNEEVRAQAKTYLWWAILAPLMGFAAFWLDGVYIGAAWSRTMRNMMIVSLVVYLMVWFLLEPLMGNHGLWLALMIFMGARGLSLALVLPGQARHSFT